MNIFFTDMDPALAASNLDDSRVNKMIIESASLLANAISFHGGSSSDLPISKTSGQPFKTRAWQNHPSCLWVKESRANYNWLLNHTIALIDELKLRRSTTHCMSDNVDVLKLGALFVPDGELTSFANCTPYKNIEDVIHAYKITMAYKWQHDAREPKWSVRGKPCWYDDCLIEEAKRTQGDFVWTGIRLSRSKRDAGWKSTFI
jgi:hypothetical protein